MDDLSDNSVPCNRHPQNETGGSARYVQLRKSPSKQRGATLLLDEQKRSRLHGAPARPGISKHARFSLLARHQGGMERSGLGIGYASVILLKIAPAGFCENREHVQFCNEPNKMAVIGPPRRKIPFQIIYFRLTHNFNTSRLECSSFLACSFRLGMTKPTSQTTNFRRLMAANKIRSNSVGRKP